MKPKVVEETSFPELVVQAGVSVSSGSVAARGAAGAATAAPAEASSAPLLPLAQVVDGIGLVAASGGSSAAAAPAQAITIKASSLTATSLAPPWDFPATWERLWPLARLRDSHPWPGLNPRRQARPASTAAMR